MVAYSTDTSAYAVWKKFGSGRPAVVMGPPVEYGDGEESYVEQVGKWFVGLKDDVKEDLATWPEDE